MEQRIKDGVFDLIIDRDQSFINTARKGKTSIIVNNRGGGIQQFNHNGRRYVSFPADMENQLQEMDEQEAEEYINNCIKLTTTGKSIYKYKDSEINEMFIDSKETYKSITGSELDITDNPLEYRASKSNKENEEDKEEGEDGEEGSCDVTTKGMDAGAGNSEIEIKQEIHVDDDGNQEYSFEDVDLNPDAKVDGEAGDRGSNHFITPKAIMDSKRELKLKALASQISKSFKGRNSKLKTIVPSKRLSSRDLVRDTDKIYVNKHGENGKFLDINLIIDMSGSMGGTPVKNAVEMVYIFNEIAIRGFCKGSVIYSDDRGRAKVNLPMPRDFVKRMRNADGRAEYIADAFKENVDILKKADINICMTDGQITDSPINKSFYEKHKIKTIGVYVNKDAKDLTEYTGSLNRWFTQSLVRHTTEELCEKIVQLGLRAKKAK